MLEALDLTLSHGRAAPAVTEASLAVAPGEVVALCGPNGAGKSTLLAGLSGEIAPRAGVVLIDGVPVARLSAAALARRRAVLEQHPHLAAPFTVTELTGLAIPREVAPAAAARIVAETLAELGLGGVAARPVAQLSGGQRHRAHLGCALAQLRAGVELTQRCGTLLLDEPTAGLDLAHGIAAMQAAKGVAAEGAGVAVVLHDLDLAAAFADRVVLMAAGRIVAAGRPEQVLTEARLSAIYDTPIRVLAEAGGGRRILPVYPRQSAATALAG